MEFDDLKKPGGTSGGLVEFVIGFIMTIARLPLVQVTDATRITLKSIMKDLKP